MFRFSPLVYMDPIGMTVHTNISCNEDSDRFPALGYCLFRNVISPDISGTGTLDCSIFTHSEDHCHYFVVHEPYREQDGTKIRGVRRLPLDERMVEMWDSNGYPMAKGNHRWTRRASWKSRAKTLSPCAVANPAMGVHA